MSVVETIGVDLGGTKMLVGVVDSERHVLHESTDTSLGLSADELLDDLLDELERARAARPAVAAAGLGIPCTIDRERGLAITAVNLPLVDIPIRDLMTERLGLPVFVDNDANAAMIAEHRFGAAQGASNAVMITVGTGIGGGLILGGEVYRGSTGAGAELGHVVVDLDGPRCQGNCPNHGCIEAVASGTALAREGHAAAERSPDSALGQALARGGAMTGRVVTDAALAGDETARDVVALVGTRLGVAFSSYANIFEPDVIVVGGGVMAAGDLLLEPAREELRARALPPMNRTPVVAAQLGGQAGMIGAAVMAMWELEQAR
ncbi:MAG TPA: ROK family protein [Solirubrobacterales bacterium]|nr:ROK family protein [Solirubrobacterales bacterium]